MTEPLIWVRAPKGTDELNDSAYGLFRAHDNAVSDSRVHARPAGTHRRLRSRPRRGSDRAPGRNAGARRDHRGREGVGKAPSARADFAPGFLAGSPAPNFTRPVKWLSRRPRPERRESLTAPRRSTSTSPAGATCRPKSRTPPASRSSLTLTAAILRRPPSAPRRRAG